MPLINTYPWKRESQYAFKFLICTKDSAFPICDTTTIRVPISFQGKNISQDQINTLRLNLTHVLQTGNPSMFVASIPKEKSNTVIPEEKITIPLVGLFPTKAGDKYYHLPPIKVRVSDAINSNIREQIIDQTKDIMKDVYPVKEITDSEEIRSGISESWDIERASGMI